MCSACAHTVRTAVGAAVHTSALSPNGEVILALFSFFFVSGFLTLAIEFRKNKLELTKGKNDFLKIIIYQYLPLIWELLLFLKLISQNNINYNFYFEVNPPHMYRRQH